MHPTDKQIEYLYNKDIPIADRLREAADLENNIPA